jgi:hypothetical protein
MFQEAQFCKAGSRLRDGVKCCTRLAKDLLSPARPQLKLRECERGNAKGRYLIGVAGLGPAGNDVLERFDRAPWVFKHGSPKPPRDIQRDGTASQPFMKMPQLRLPVHRPLDATWSIDRSCRDGPLYLGFLLPIVLPLRKSPSRHALGFSTE